VAVWYVTGLLGKVVSETNWGIWKVVVCKVCKAVCEEIRIRELGWRGPCVSEWAASGAPEWQWVERIGTTAAALIYIDRQWAKAAGQSGQKVGVRPLPALRRLIVLVVAWMDLFVGPHHEMEAAVPVGQSEW